MKSLIPIFTLGILLLCAVTVSAQSSKSKPVTQDSIVIKIPGTAVSSPQSIGLWLKNNTPNQYEAVKALYYWIGHNIAYDVVMWKSDEVYKDTADAAAQTLSRRKGICQGYCSLFYEVCKHAGITTHLISGYVYIFGQLSLDGGHNWIGIKLNNKWGIIDPTWGTGTVDDKNKFEFGFNWDQFMIPPEKAIYTHVPFDPVYQYLIHPIKPSELRDQTWAEASKRRPINFEDSLQAFSKQNLLQSYTGRLQRLQNFGIINQLQREEEAFLKEGMPYAAYATDSASGVTRKYYALIDRSNALVENFNAYAEYINGGMKPAKSDAQIMEWLNNLSKEAKDIYTQASPLTFLSSDLKENKTGFIDSMKSMMNSIADSQKSMSDYLAQKKQLQR